ncbi:Moderate conductance mechanosensitive channel YbiO [bacterium HR40]|nr:Moderate conductance mechanosensitive channel YbiO [bacterium HR40]
MPRFIAILAISLVAATATGGAQTPAQIASQPPPTASPNLAATAPGATAGATLEPAIRPETLRELIVTLRDERERELFLKRLEALLAAQEAAMSPQTEALGLLAQLEEAANARLAAVRSAFADLASSFRQIHFLVTWLRLEFADPVRRELWFGLFRQLGGAILLGALSALVFRRFMMRRVRASAARVHEGKGKLAAAAMQVVADMLVVALFAGTLYLTLHLSGASSIVLRAAEPVIAGAMLGRLVAALAKVALAPQAADRRLLPLADDDAARLWRAITLLNALLVYATAILWLAAILGLPWTIRGFFERIVYFAAAVVLAAVCLRYRVPVGEWLAARARQAAGLLARFFPWERLARAWHVVAIVVVFAHYLVFALQVPGGFFFLFRVTVLTLLLLVLARLAVMTIDWLFGQVTLPAAEEEGAAGDQRLRRRYLQWTRAVLRTAVIVLAILLVLGVWGVDVLGWLTAGEGRVLLVSVMRLAIAFLLSVAVIEGANVLARRYMEATTADGRPLYGNRARTLASIARNGVILFVGLTFLLLFLSEIGVQAGPLLAGAGVVGLAVGFGSQKLVQDLITGLFILLGDTIRVGDVVDLGGKSGVVEAMSMRTVTLRSYDGSVHTIPYSSIDTVTNLTKDFSYWVVDVGVAYREDIDQVIRVLQEIDEQMRREWPFRRIVLQPIEIAGLDRFADSAVVVRARIKTRPGEQWRVGREFNRRLKKRFDELGIEIPFPHRTLYFGVDRNGKAPPAFVQLLAAEASAVEPASQSAAVEPRG